VGWVNVRERMEGKRKEGGKKEGRKKCCGCVVVCRRNTHLFGRPLLLLRLHLRLELNARLLLRLAPRRAARLILRLARRLGARLLLRLGAHPRLILPPQLRLGRRARLLLVLAPHHVRRLAQRALLRAAHGSQLPLLQRLFQPHLEHGTLRLLLRRRLRLRLGQREVLVPHARLRRGAQRLLLGGQQAEGRGLARRVRRRLRRKARARVRGAARAGEHHPHLGVALVEAKHVAGAAGQEPPALVRHH
jgi:hypothetical protein